MKDRSHPPDGADPVFQVALLASWYAEVGELSFESRADLLDAWRQTGKVQMSAAGIAFVEQALPVDWELAKRLQFANANPSRALYLALKDGVREPRSEAWLHALRRDPRPQLVAVEWPQGRDGDELERWTDLVLGRWNQVEEERELLRHEWFATWPADCLVTLQRPMAQTMRSLVERHARRVLRAAAAEETPKRGRAVRAARLRAIPRAGETA